MDRTFEILEAFLAQGRNEVTGRALERIPPELQRRLRAFAQAQLSVQDRAELAEVLKEHPGWIRFLAEQIRAERSDEDAKP